MASTLFGATVPTLTNLDDGNTYVLGTAFTADVDGTITHLRRYFPTTGQSGVSQGLYRDSDQALLGSVSWPDGTATGWQQMALASPVAVTAGQTYQTTYFTPSKYVATTAYGFPFTSGDLTAIAANGKFNASVPSLQFATGSLGGTAVFADVVFEAAGAVTIVPNGLAVPVAVGSPAVALGLSAAPSGLAVPVGFGSPTVALNRSGAPTGLAIGLAVGTPTVTRPGVAPSGLAVPVGLGSPATAGAVTPAGISIGVALGFPATVGQTPVPVVRRSGWNTYGDAMRWNAEEARREVETPPVSCPNDGEALEFVGSQRHCPADGWTWPERRILNRAGID